MSISNTPDFTNPIGIAPVYNMPLYFVSAASPIFANNAIDIAGASPGNGALIVLWPLGYSGTSWNSSWMLTPKGMILCSAYPQMVLGVSGANVILCNRNDSDPTQYWTVAGTPGAYTIVNNSTNEAITAPDSQIVYKIGGPPSPQLTTTAVGGQSEQLWAVQPVVVQQPPNNQFYIQTGLSGAVNSQANPYMLTTDASGNTPGALIKQWQPGAQSQLWIFNADGTIASASLSSPNYQLVLNSTSTSNKDTSPVTLIAPSGSAAQQWTYSNNQLSVNMGGDIGTLYLNVDQGNGSIAITWEQTNGNNETWYTLSAQSIPIGEWFYLQTEMTAGGGDDLPFVLTISSTVANANTGVVIEPLQPGALNQLWQINAQGVIISALDRSMALTAVSGGDQLVTIQPVQSSQSWQQWYRLSNGMLGIGTSGNVWFLNVKGGENAAPGTQVITNGFQSIAPNVVWNTIPYIPEPSGLWFTIQTALAAPGAQTPYLLTVLNDWGVGLKTPLGGYMLPQGQAAINQLWRKTLNGTIVSATNPNLVLTGATAGGDVSLAPLQSGSADQQWFWGYSQELAIEGHRGNVLCGVLQNLGQNQVLWAPGIPNTQISNIVTLAPAATANDTTNQLWFVLPHAMPFGESTTIRNVGGADEVAGLFLSLPAKPASGNFAAVVNQQSGNPALSMWQFQFPGYIVSDIDPDIVLSLELGSGGTVQNPVYSNNVVAYPRQPGAQPFQLWAVTPEGLIVNQYNGQALAASAASAPSGVITTALSNDPKTNLQLWDFSPGMVLQTTLAQPPVSYPAWNKKEETAYTAICAELGLPNGIRAQYANLAAPLSNYQLQMNLSLISLVNGGALTGSTPQPTEEQIGDWIIVTRQLNKEITAVTAVQLLFQQVTTLLLSLSQAQAMTLSELITGCALPNKLKTPIPPQVKKKRGWITDLVEGLTYTALNVAGSLVGDPEAGKELSMGAKFVKNGLPCIANLMSTGVSTTQNGLQGRSQTKANSQMAKYAAVFNKAMQNIYNYEMTVLGMEEELLSEFEATGSALGQIEAIILADWDKLQAAYDMTRSIGTMSSLYWPSTMTPMQANQMLSGYTIGVLQTLLPLNTGFKNTATMHANYGSLISPAGWQNDGSFVEEENPDGTQNIYSTTVNQQMLGVIWDNGVDPLSFFKGMNGWSLPLTYQNLVANDNSTLSQFAAEVIVTIQNFTNQEFTLNLTLNSLIGTETSFGGNNVFPLTTKTLEAYGVQQFAGACWQCYVDNGPGSSGYIGAALQGNINILNSEQANVMSVYVDNSYNSGGNQTAPATYNWSNLTFVPPYSVAINQDVTPSGMVLVAISISVVG
ncbi:hypothetical protein SAMN05428975_4842 [Mucilaginibacter sp. OK268]|uniref:hypothetical protein n=1 Tax=Mucilaginibacter sp. OK268 TaxID=1881048 RepID=UPI00088D1E80|nr:hypothetical protein [Mucilaginibacter sp. OK268]SDP98920.1 hypothetical protein SAMN05428975_4842 [Mucilaginibacter sp. OK268]